MKKRILSLLMVLAMVLSLLPMNVLMISAEPAESGELPNGAATIVASGTCGANGDNLTWTLDDEGTLTISGTGKMKDYFISRKDSEGRLHNPSPWYAHRSRIKTVAVQDGVSDIGNWAFYDCGNLTSITIPNSVINIGNYALSECGSLVHITIPSSVLNIGERTFCGCSNLQCITIPDSVTSIGIGLFEACSSLQSVTIGNGVTSIRDYTFYMCNDLAEVAIPSGVTNIGDCAFNSCSSLRDVYYGGTEVQWSNTSVYYSNYDLFNATIHYNHIHQFIQDTVVAPTCAEPGYTEHLCGYGETVRDSFLPALGHVHADDDSGVVTAPTCAEQGYTTYICKRCGESYQGDFVDTVPHDYEAVVTAPTCTEQGYTTYTCSHCGEWYTDNYTDAAGHHIVVDEAVEATCITDGHTIGSHCDRCRQVFIMPTVLPATGKHVSSDENRATATHRAICDLCGQEYGEPLPITCDLNGDDKTDADDLAILLRHVAKIEVITDEDLLPRLDLDGSGAVNAADVTALAKLLSK